MQTKKDWMYVLTYAAFASSFFLKIVCQKMPRPRHPRRSVKFSPDSSPTVQHSCRRESVSKSLWDEGEINTSLRAFCLREQASCPEEVLSAVEADDAEAVNEKTKVGNPYSGMEKNREMLYVDIASS